MLLQLDSLPSSNSSDNVVLFSFILTSTLFQNFTLTLKINITLFINGARFLAVIMFNKLIIFTHSLIKHLV